MLRDWEKRFPGRLDSIFNALAHVVPSHLMDRRLNDFGAVRATHRPEPDGDLAFDVEMPSLPPGVLPVEAESLLPAELPESVATR
jgi:tRNA 2-thiocytidine biosynthesis protein TtcA